MNEWLKPTARVFACVQALFGIALVFGGIKLIALGGSWYYALAGIAYLASAWWLWRLQVKGAWLAAGIFVLTLLWALAESGWTFWPMVPRLVLPGIFAMLALLLAPGLGIGPNRRSAAHRGAAAAVFLLLVGILWAAFLPHGVVLSENGATHTSPAAAGTSDWTHYGHDATGGHFAPFDQINLSNISRLKVAWTFRTGDEAPGEDQNIPMQVGDFVYSCSRNGRIAALDADTGEVRWRFDPKSSSPFWQRCRGLGYYDSGSTPEVAGATPASCSRRILKTTIDARLFALDAKTGEPCADFGNGGVVDLKVGMGEVKPGFYMQTSAPLVARNLIIIGGWVVDNQEVGEPSGVVRAFDVMSGALVWAWDLGNPEVTRDPPEGQTYTRGTPNMWSTASFDDKLGLVYLPLGNATPDYYGAQRSKESEQYSSSIVALDVVTGRLKWSVQTTHHDIWDYDVASQPVLVDLPDGKGGTVPALLQPTKRGQLFLLNRATGEALAEIAEKPVPQAGQAPGEWLAKTQPYSVGMPSVGAERLSESQMWGMSTLDQLWCRIKFRQLNYDGDFTPPSEKGSIEYPGNFGGFNWGGASLDATNGYAYLNDNRLPIMITLKPAEEVQRIIAASGGVPTNHGPSVQAGTPFGVTVVPMLSPMGVPCNQPPYGTITAVNLNTRKIAWQVPVGTVQDTGPLGIVTHLRMPVGMPTIGGTLATASGLVFFAGSQDFYLRALDATNGREIWKGRLPVGSGSTPMSYVSPTSGKQYVLISSGGARDSPVRGDYLVAYALEDSR